MMETFYEIYLTPSVYILFQEEIAAINLAKYRKAQQDFEEAEERSKICEANITKYKSARGVSMSPGPVSWKQMTLKASSI